MSSITLPLTPLEDQVLAELAREEGLSEQGVLRQALRLYQERSIKHAAGLRLAYLDAGGREEQRPPMLMPLES